MKEEDKRESLGGYLKRLREQLGFTLQDISSKTKISLAYLENLENEEFSSLPNEVFVKGFLRSYAKVLGLEEYEVLDRFQHWKAAHQPDSSPVNENAVMEDEKERRLPHIPLDRIRSLYETKKWLHRKILLNLFIGIVIVGGAFVLFSKRNVVENQVKEMEPVSSGNSLATNTPPALAVAPSTAISSSMTGSAQESVEKSSVKAPSLHLTVQATDRSWISVVVDDGVIKEFSLHPEDKIALEAEKRFLLNIGNAGGVKLTLNGKPLGPYGKKGEIVKGIKIEP